MPSKSLCSIFFPFGVPRCWTLISLKAGKIGGSITTTAIASKADQTALGKGIIRPSARSDVTGYTAVATDSRKAASARLLTVK